MFLNTSLHKQDPNLYYFSKAQIEFGVLVIPANSKPVLLVPEFEQQRLKNESKVRVVAFARKGRAFAQLRKYIHARKIGINKEMVSLREYSALKKALPGRTYTDVAEQCLALRAIKTNEEIKILKKACSITTRILEDCIHRFRRLKTEKDVAFYLEGQARKAGCELSFPVIVASGKHGSLPHHTPQNAKLQKGFCVIDFGIIYNGYCSDITRTVYIGKPSAKELKDYNLVLNTQQKIIRQISLGGKLSSYYQQAAKALGKDFTHSLGHGIGVEIHESPNLSPGSKDKVQGNMVFTIEPGIYRKNKWGIRIEDDILITPGGKPVILTSLARKLAPISH